MSVAQSAINRRSRARINRPKGLRLRGQVRTRKSLIETGFGGKISKTAKKSGGK